MYDDSELAERLATVARWLKEAKLPVVFTGAGMSAESGIPTFRDSDGLWQRFPPEQFANWRSLLEVAARSPRRVAEFVVAVLEPIAQAVPNPGHLSLAELEKHKRLPVITQNIDALHSEAGHREVYEIHGCLLEVADLRGRVMRRLSRHELMMIVAAVRRAKKSRLTLVRLLVALRPIFGTDLWRTWRPNVVLFGQSLAQPAWDNAVKLAEECDLFLSIGTSSTVMPAAMLPQFAAAHGAKIVVIDPVEHAADVWLSGSAATVVPRLVKAVLKD